MIISLAVSLIAVFSGTLLSYLYDEGSSFGYRICGGACVGIALLGLVGFGFASFLGLTAVSVTLTLAVLCGSAFLLVDNGRRRALAADLYASSDALRKLSGRSLPYVAFYGAIALIFWRIFDRAVIEDSSGIFTGLLNNFGDLPFHISVITSFAYGDNFPPQDPTFAGVPFTYPFLTDFVSAIFVRCGASLRESMFIENFILAVAFVGLIQRWAWVMLRDRLASFVTPVLALLNGGFGWILLFEKGKQNEQGLFGVLSNLPPSVTVIPETTWRWGNAISALLVPQRGILLGLPLAVMVFTQWWLAIYGDVVEGRRDGEKGKRRDSGKRTKKTKKNKDSDSVARSRILTPLLHVKPEYRMAAAGVIAGLLPLVHAHSFVVVMVVGACIGLLQRRWREWATFVVVASVVALPQMWWSIHHSAVDATKFFEWQFGWDRGSDSALWFWFKNTGLFIPLIVVAILWRGKEYLVPRRLLMFYLPFTLCFIIPNVLKMAPWIWDNIKVLYYWWLASAPLVAVLLSKLWRQGKGQRALAVALFLCVILAGALDVAAITLQSTRYQIFDESGIKFAELVKQQTEPKALTVHAPVHNHPIFLTGRRSLLGYPGHIWTHGLDFTQRESEIRRIYSGAPDASLLLRKYNIEYLVVGPHERNVLTINEQFISQFGRIGEDGEYRLFKVTP
ncbi:MAG: hypothetical protein C5B44_02590 [Acidobacteria bacterium]|nr:MAG: hypothetical protein C5B44_02590 [Acidobacteriota bacterium]